MEDLKENLLFIIKNKEKLLCIENDHILIFYEKITTIKEIGFQQKLLIKYL